MHFHWTAGEKPLLALWSSTWTVQDFHFGIYKRLLSILEDLGSHHDLTFMDFICEDINLIFPTIFFSDSIWVEGSPYDNWKSGNQIQKFYMISWLWRIQKANLASLHWVKFYVYCSYISIRLMPIISCASFANTSIYQLRIYDKYLVGSSHKLQNWSPGSYTVAACKVITGFWSIHVRHNTQ